MSGATTPFVRLCLVAALALLVGCTPGLHIRDVTIAGAPLPTEFENYRWQPGLMQDATNKERVDTQYTTVIQQTIDRAMSNLGYTLADNDDEALILSLQLTIDDVVEAYGSPAATAPVNEASDYGLRWRLPRGATPVTLERATPAEEIAYFSEGILHIGAFTPDRAPIWHVMGHKILDSMHSAEEHQAALENTITQIMARFPARAPDSSAARDAP